MVMSPLRVSVEASEMEPASEEDIIWEVSPFVVAELLPDAMVHKKESILLIKIYLLHMNLYLL